VSEAAPIFSVVTPSWNQGAWLGDCIESVLAQKGHPFEHIVFDNCSTDETPAVLGRYPHLHTHIERDTGQANALNKGFRLARGEVICWLNSDDRYAPGAFDVVQRELLDAGRDVIFGNTREIFFDGQGERIHRARFKEPAGLLRWWDRQTSILQPAVFFTRRALEAAGLLREDLYIVMDLELWWRMAQRFPFHYVNEVLAVQLRQPESKTVKEMPRIIEEKARVFTPELNAREPDRRWRNAFARRRGMGRRWVGSAHLTAATNPIAARDFLRRALRENPALIATPSWWSALIRAR
jgi:glycosyltransferase involved in cell wall biosynthesis